jgi:iron complex outermembrane recepter protein
MKLRAAGISVTALYFALASGSVAMAQDAPAEEAAETEGLTEIIVTAQRKEENLQRAAIAVDVVSSDELVKAQVTSPTQLTSLVPSLQAGSIGGGNVAFFLRGVGSFSANPYTDSAVSFNVDGVTIGRPSATTGYFYDVGRLEVLKGPQGTLYGRNATGGAINVIPAAPRMGETSGFASLSYGNYDAIAVQGAVNVGISDNAAFRLSGNLVKRDGFQTDGTNDDDGRAVRAQFLVEPSDDLTIRVSADYFKRGGQGSSATIIGRVPINPFTNSFVIQPSGFASNVGSNDPLVGAFLSSTFNGLAGRTLQPFASRTYLDGKFWGVNAQIDWQTPIGKLTIIPALRKHDTDEVTNGGGFVIYDTQDFRQTSLEARLAGDVGPVDYLLGGFLYDEKLDALYVPSNGVANSFQDFTTTTKSAALFGRLTFNVSDRFRLVGGMRYTKDRKTFVGGATTVLATCAVPTGCPGAPLIPFVRSPAEVISTLGLVAVVPNAVFIQPGNPAAVNRRFVFVPVAKDDQLSNGKVTFRAAGEFDVSSTSLLYASVETGFRAGGFSFAMIKPRFDPESITAYTLGSKNRFLDNKLQLNLEAFVWKYKDQQVSHAGVEADGRNTFFTENVGTSTNKGFEIELQALPVKNTLLAANIQYLDAKYDNFVFNVPATRNPVLSTPTTPVFFPLVTGCGTSMPTVGTWAVDCSGLQASRAPKWTMTFGLQQTYPIGDNRIVLGWKTRYQSSNFTGFDHLPTDLQKSYWLSSADLTFFSKEDRFSISAFVNNIENNRIVQSTTYFSATSLIGATVGDPRTYGLRLGVNF